MAGIFVEIVGNASQFKRELDSAVASTAKANSGFHKMGRAAGVAGLALAGGLAIGLTHAAKGALEDQVANERLAKSFENAHVPIGAFKDQIEKATSAAVKMGFHDEEAATSLGSLVTATHNGKKAIDLLGTAMDIARFKHVDLDAASKMLTSTMAGNVRSAKALGIVLLPVTSHVDALRAKYKELGEAIPPAELATAKIADKQATAAQAIGKVNDALHGQAKAFSETAAGKAQIFNAQMDQLSDNLGKKVLPALNFVLDKLNAFAAIMEQHKTVTVAFTIALGALAAALIAVSVATAIAEAAMSPLLLPIAAAVVAIGVLSFVAYKLVTDFKNSWPLLLPIVLGPLGAIIAAVIHWHSQITGFFTSAWNTIKSVTSAGISAVLGAIRGAIGAALSAGQAVGRAIVEGHIRALAALVGAVTSAFSRVWAAVRGFVGRALSEGAAIGSAIMHGIASGIKGALGSAIGAIEDAGKALLSHARHFLHIGSPSLEFARKVGAPIAEGIALGIRQGQGSINTALIDGVAKAKAGADDWIDSKGVDNMTEKGRVMGAALAGGFGTQLSGAALVNAPAATTAMTTGLTGSALVNAPLGAMNSSPVVLHNVLQLDGKVIYDDWKKQAGRDVNRNGGTGVRA